jgi:hypothetical protein
MTQEEAKIKKQELIERVVEQIKDDLNTYGTEAIEELLGFCRPRFVRPILFAAFDST